MLKFTKIEKWIYTGVLLVSLYPLFFLQFFPTLDGPAHVYNSELILRILCHENAANYFQFSQGIVPNWIGHMILSIFGAISSPIWAEKILLIFYLIGFPLTFRYLLKVISPSYKLYSYLIIPFVYSQLFLLGFYNFSLAFIPFFLVTGYWLRINSKNLTLKHLLILAFLLFTCYLSHIVVCFISIYSLFALQIFNSELTPKKRAFQFIKLLIAALPTLLLGVWYILRMPKDLASNYINTSELWLKLFNLESLIGYNREIESPFTRVIFWILMISIVLVVYFNLNQKSKNDFFVTIKSKFVWITLPVLMLVAYFTLPDSNAYAGYVSIRFNYLFFVFLILLIANFKIPGKILGAISTSLIIAHFGLNIYYFKTLSQLNEIAENCYNIGEHLSENDIVKPINHNTNWLTGHFSNYAGLKNTPILLENYEATTNYFPLTWKSDLDLSSLAPSHIFVLKDNLDAANKYDTLYPNYKKIVENQHCILFKTRIEVNPR